MRIGIDARFFGPKDKGFGRYAENLIKNLEKIDRNNQYFVFLKKQGFEDYNPQNPNFEKVLADYNWYGIREQLFYPVLLKKYKLDLIHFTHFNAPIFYNRRFIITIHDLTLRKFPTHKKNLWNFLVYWFKKIAYFVVFKKAIKKSEKVIAISDFTKNEILRQYKVPEEKIKVIYEGVFEITQNLAPKKEENKNRYLFYVGNAYPHKNLKNLVFAFDLIKKDPAFRELKLMLVGGSDYYYNKLKKTINLLSCKNSIVFTGFVPDEKLDDLYGKAELCVFPSLYEGFGLPPLEAMARGLAVVSSNASCMPEILGSAAHYFDPFDIFDMADKIKEVLSDKEKIKKLVHLGYEQAKKYSWEKMAQKIFSQYQL